MSTKLSLPSVPDELQAVHRQFEQWRRVRQARDRIPDRLWTVAAAVARTYGVSRTARLLHLEPRKLKHFVTAAHPRLQASPLPAFVELLAPQPLAAGGECTIEIDAPQGGRLRMQLRGVPLPDLAALSRAVWRPEA